MRRPLSLALRLTLFYGIAAAIVFTGFGWIIGRSIEMHFKSEDVSELKVIVQAVHRAMSSVRSEDELARLARRFDDILVGHHGASLYIAGQNQHAIFASAEPDLSTFVATVANNINGVEAVQQWNDGHNTYRVLIQRLGEDTVVAGGPFTLAVAVPIDYHLHFLDSFRHTLWLMIVCGIVITSLMGWIAVRQGHAPLRHIVNQIRQISANELKTRLSSETVPAELADLAVSFNEMLERVEEAFQRLSNFSADIAHELRTPVTSLMTQTQVVLSQARSIEEYREILYSNIEEYERMAQMIGDMLFLAKADNGLCKPNTTDVDLRREVQDLFDYYEVWAEERHIKLSLEGSAIVSGDRLMLRRALSNLLSNAIRHTPSGQTVWVKLEAGHNDEIDISVENPGTVIAAEHIPRLFDRFYRVDPSRQRSGEGTGLGLAIVKSIVDAHGGRIEVKSTDDYTIFRITLHN
ncbi:MAG: heavy metal sensor histidine kinase [Gammaproteobacteria bacterium]|nr:heavy metal sensor histidine kinase [Gammaproteobacteria bacterium]